MNRSSYISGENNNQSWPDLKKSKHKTCIQHNYQKLSSNHGTFSSIGEGRVASKDALNYEVNASTNQTNSFQCYNVHPNPPTSSSSQCLEVYKLQFSKNSVLSPKEKIISSRPNTHCENKWNTTEHDQNINHANFNHSLTLPIDKENFSTRTSVLLEEHSIKSEELQKVNLSESKTNIMSREELTARRKLKVAEKKEIKRQEKRQIAQIKDIVCGVQVAKPDFSLERAAEDFPALSASVKKKKVVKYNKNNETQPEDHVAVERSNYPTTITEKSWKPKIKDPININISHALQSISEKSKPALKRTEPAAHCHIAGGNILDSDNPQRKKGKVRPDKVKKPSKLKSHILSERHERRKLLSLKDQDCQEILPDSTNREVRQENCSQFTYLNDEISSLFAQCSFIETNSNKINLNEAEQICKQEDVKSLMVAKSIHSRKFREYCTNCLTEELITSVCSLLEKVAYFQDRTFVRDPIKASAKRRYVAGLNQANKYLRVKKVKLIIIAPDLEKNIVEGGLDERIRLFIKDAEFQDVPCVFGPNRKRLGRAVKKNALVSCVAILSYEGAEEQFSKVMEAYYEAKSKYESLTGCCQEEKEVVKEQSSAPLLKDECEYTSASDITSSLLATLKEEMVSADKLMCLIKNTAGCIE